MKKKNSPQNSFRRHYGLLALLFACPPAGAQTASPRLIIAPLSADDVKIPGAKPRKKDFELNFGAADGRPSAGVGVRLSEGKPLETMLWGGGGAMIGSVAGPLGAIVGAAVGALAGLVVSIFIVPHNGPDEAELVARRR